MCLVCVTDKDGRTGWGEGTTYWPEAAATTAVLVEALAPGLVVLDPIQNETVMQRLCEQTWWYGTEQAGIIAFALSAIDVALWDLKWKILGARVLDLLGGPAKTELPAIASSHATRAEIPAMAEEIAGWLATGLTGVKVGFGKLEEASLGFDHDRDVAFVNAVREEIGPEKRLMIDIGVRKDWTMADAIRRASKRSPSTDSTGSRSRLVTTTRKATPGSVR